MSGLRFLAGWLVVAASVAVCVIAQTMASPAMWIWQREVALWTVA
jgi:hypothetical protein